MSNLEIKYTLEDSEKANIQRNSLSYQRVYPKMDEVDQLISNQPKFIVGNVIKHLKFGYRGIIVGYDQRPLVDVSTWEAVNGLPSGSDQIFYKVSYILS